MSDTNYRTHSKYEAQLANVQAWRKLSGRDALAEGEEYWTLIALPSFEVETLEGAGFLLSRSQFVGVNYAVAVCDGYKASYGVTTVPLPWNLAIRERALCPMGGLVYLDTTDEITENPERVAQLISTTVALCGAPTLVCANFCLTNPRRGHRHASLDSFVTQVELPDGWDMTTWWDDGQEYDYYLPGKTNRTQMVTFFFHNFMVAAQRFEVETRSMRAESCSAL